MSFSLNEVDGMAKRATRGAGYSWGIAEEAGKATRALSAHGLDGSGLLAGLLERSSQLSPGDLTPQNTEADWNGAAGLLCPLMAGTTLADYASRIGPREIAIDQVLYPALIIPFAVNAARQIKATLALTWTDIRVVCSGSAFSVQGPDKALNVATCDRLTLRQGGDVGTPLTRQSRATPAPADWATLGSFAHRTYAPATDASRLSGAGAGLSDND